MVDIHCKSARVSALWHHMLNSSQLACRLSIYSTNYHARFALMTLGMIFASPWRKSDPSFRLWL